MEPSRSRTCARANQRSVPSSKTSVTWESPYFDIERTRRRFGRPPIACSTRALICCSTSTGERDGAVVLTCTMTSVTSGKASTESPCIANSPLAMRATESRSTSPRLRRDASMIQFSIGSGWPGPGRSLGASAGAELAAHDLGLEEEAPRGRELLARGEAAPNLVAALVHGAELDLPRLEDVGGGPHEDEVAVAVVLHRGLRDEELRPGRAHQHLGPPEHVGAEEPLRVLHFGDDTDGAGALVHLAADGDQPAGE